MSKEIIEKQVEKEYRSMPFWSWNDKLEPEKLIKQIHWMNKKGMGGFFMHARTGLQTEYLSEEWMKCIEVCAKEAKKLGMKAWIYDENGWPSGFVGGKLLEEEKNRDKYILSNIGEFDAEATVNYLIKDEELVRVSKKEKEETYLNLYIHTAVSTSDILNPEVVEQFLTLTHEKYQEYFGASFAEYIEGFFTDEPQYHRWNTPYTDVIAKYYKDEYKEDILDGLGLLFVEKKGYRQFRYRYWKTMQKLMLQNFAQRVYSWCDEHGVKLTGHYIEESTIGYQIMCCGGVMPFYEYEHIPGIDKLGKHTPRILLSKQVGSVAAQLDKKHVLTESYAMCGWDVSLSELRRITGLQYVHGVNILCQHLLPYSERGVRKYDYPAHYSDINPWVEEEFQTFNKYFSNLGAVLGEGKQHVNVAVLHPLRSGYFNYKRELMDEGFGIGDLDESLKETCEQLAASGIEYHFLDETLLEKYGFVKDGRIGCGQCEYEFLILPYILTMDESTERLLFAYVEQGGKVLILGDKPSYRESQEYEYEYLQNNVTLSEIMNAQVYRVQNLATEIQSTYRTFNDESYLYVINGSEKEEQTQVYDFGTNVKSFRKVDLLTGEEKKVPLSVTLKPGEDALLCPSSEELSCVEKKNLYVLQFQNAAIAVDENYMPVDNLRYSTNGETFSEPWPCPALFQKLLRERYEGTIFFRYEFEMQSIPEKIYLRAEKSNDIAAWFNGHLLQETVFDKEDYVKRYDISDYVKKGVNVYDVQVDWHENENVYYALFGENVTESVKNCVVYDTEIQPIEIVGSFGVYPVNGYEQDEDEHYVKSDAFYIGDLPNCVSEPSMEGFPFLSGQMILRQNVTFEEKDVLLEVTGDYQLAEVKVNGRTAGKLLFDRQIDISDVAKAGENDIEIRFLLSNRNRLGPHHYAKNKNGPVVPGCFGLGCDWKEDKCEQYHSCYYVKKTH